MARGLQKGHLRGGQFVGWTPAPSNNSPMETSTLPRDLHWTPPLKVQVYDDTCFLTLKRTFLCAVLPFNDAELFL